MESTTTQVEISRFEAFALYKHYCEKVKECQAKGLLILAEEYNLKSYKWLDIAVAIEESNSDGINEFLKVN